MEHLDPNNFQCPLSKLTDYNPFENIIWASLKSSIKKKEVEKAILENNLYSDYVENKSSLTRQEHISRIAFFVINGWENTINLDVGVPSLLCYVDYILDDGHHRLGAAFYKKDKTILASVSGQLSYAEELLELKFK